jgi:hypothetical protein
MNYWRCGEQLDGAEMIVRVGARLLASPFQLLPLPAWHLFNLSSLFLSFCYNHFTNDNSANWSISHIFKYIYMVLILVK